MDCPQNQTSLNNSIDLKKEIISLKKQINLQEHNILTFEDKNLQLEATILDLRQENEVF